MGLLTSGMYGASHVRTFSQSMPENKADRRSQACFPPGKSSVWSGCTGEERVVLEVLDAVLTQSVLSAADESADQVLGLLGHVSHLLGELEPLLGGKDGAFPEGSGHQI